jgi:hypothetical protein
MVVILPFLSGSLLNAYALFSWAVSLWSIASFSSLFPPFNSILRIAVSEEICLTSRRIGL